jgi:hypothetical protein
MSESTMMRVTAFETVWLERTEEFSLLPDLVISMPTRMQKVITWCRVE